MSTEKDQLPADDKAEDTEGNFRPGGNPFHPSGATGDDPEGEGFRDRQGFRPGGNPFHPAVPEDDTEGHFRPGGNPFHPSATGDEPQGEGFHPRGDGFHPSFHPGAVPEEKKNEG